jgi:hypothetical protein
MEPSRDFFAQRTAVLATMHRKEQVMEPILTEALGIKLIVPKAFNTDSFGTFTRDIPRAGTQREAALHKAQQALALTGMDLAIASEGSFQPHPACPFICINCELVILLDTRHDLVLVGEYCSMTTNFNRQTIRSLTEAQIFATKAGFPSHGVIIFTQPELGDQSPAIKGIITPAQLEDAVKTALQASATIAIETDMRAMYNPTRMSTIAQATQDLVHVAHSQCPQCQWPGFAMVKRYEGLPCAECHFPTERIRAVLYQCQKCAYPKEVPFPDGLTTADPTHCPMCNP